MSKKRLFTTRQLVAIAILSAFAFGLQNIETAIAIFPDFLKLELSDIPAVMGAIVYGPLAGVFIELIKNIIHLMRTSSAGIGELANFVVGSAIVIPIGIMCREKKTMRNFVIGALLGIVSMAIVAALMNAFILLPFYAKLYGKDVQFFIDMATVIFPFIDTYIEFILFSIIPFNLFKGTIIVGVSGLVYKYLKVNTYLS